MILGLLGIAVMFFGWGILHTTVYATRDSDEARKYVAAVMFLISGISVELAMVL